METKLNDNEVREIAQMQRTIDTYESFISTAYAMIMAKRTNINYLMMEETPLTEEMNAIWRFVKTAINESKGK